MKIQRPTSPQARIEILPLIDIVFLLLVFFIYAMLSMAVHRGMPVQLPSSSTAQRALKGPSNPWVATTRNMLLPFWVNSMWDAVGDSCVMPAFS